jgi:hypothetical protein
MAMIMISIAVGIVVAVSCDYLLIQLTLGRSPLLKEPPKSHVAPAPK